MNRAQKLRSQGFTPAKIAEVLGLTKRQVWKRLGKKYKPKPETLTDTDYLKRVAQIPDAAALAMHRGGQPTTEQELECERVIWEVATVQIRKVAPLRSERFLLRMPKVLTIAGRRR